MIQDVQAVRTGAEEAPKISYGYDWVSVTVVQRDFMGRGVEGILN